MQHEDQICHRFRISQTDFAAVFLTNVMLFFWWDFVEGKLWEWAKIAKHSGDSFTITDWSVSCGSVRMFSSHLPSTSTVEIQLIICHRRVLSSSCSFWISCSCVSPEAGENQDFMSYSNSAHCDGSCDGMMVTAGNLWVRLGNGETSAFTNKDATVYCCTSRGTALIGETTIVGQIRWKVTDFW